MVKDRREGFSLECHSFAGRGRGDNSRRFVKLGEITPSVQPSTVAKNGRLLNASKATGVLKGMTRRTRKLGSGTN